MLLTVLNSILFLALIPLGLAAGYLLLLTVTAWFGAKTTPNLDRQATHKFLLVIPAHNEEKLLPSTLESLNQIDYPKSLYEIHVVADNCVDTTAEIARQHGATAHERFHQTLKGKGYALQWLLGRIWEQEIPHDAIVFLDADTVVSDNFLRVMDSRLAAGQRVIQAYYAVRDPEKTWGISLRYAALAVLHFLRPLGRMVLGGSTGLKGNGMVFTADLVRNHEWSASLTEDIEFHMNLILQGERAMFAPDAVVWAEMPETLADSNTQNERWERGRMEMIRNFVPTLFKQAFASRPVNRRFLLLDAAVEQLIPPFSVLMGLTLMTNLCAIAFFILARGPFSAINLTIGLFTLISQVIYLLSGLRLAKAPAGVYRALLYAPGFIAWKVWLYLQVLLKRSNGDWIRTARNEE